jgi:hypothetical protein
MSKNEVVPSVPKTVQVDPSSSTKERSGGEISAVQGGVSQAKGSGKGKRFMKLKGLVDSGAVDNVTNERTAPWIPIQQTRASRAGLTYTVADGRSVPNKGQQRFQGVSEDGLPIDMGVQVTDVVKTLFAVRRMKEAGNVVIFGAEEGDMIINKQTGSRTMIEDDGENYLLTVYMEIPEVPKAGVQRINAVSKTCDEQCETGGRFCNKTMWSELAGNEEVESFTRQDI